MRRRDVLLTSFWAPFAITDVAASLTAPAIARAAAPPAPPPQPASPQPFDANTVRNLARDIAAKPFQPPNRTLPDAFAHLDYDAYRMVRFRTDRAIWRGDGLPFQVELFHRGYLYIDRVDIYEVANGQAHLIAYDPGYFDFGKLAPPTGENLGYAGFRIHAPFIRPDYFDEVCAFLGASYFRAVGKGQGYGLSARGLSIKTGDPSGEEFPLFRAFWLERPGKDATAVVVNALLDSQSAAASFRFTIRPGNETVFDTEMTLFPRVDLAEAGIAPMTSMFLFDANDRTGFDDTRRAVHDSGGLLMLSGRGERVWRPLANPTDLQISAFADTGPRGFGLMQRKRDYAAYEDLEADYQKRPSLWVEPIGDAGDGAVTLVEIPSQKEMNDNIVAFWRPKQALKAKGEFGYTYRLHWCDMPPLPAPPAMVVDTRCGTGGDANSRRFVLDFTGEALKSPPKDAAPHLDVTTDKGAVRNVTVQPNPYVGGITASFELVPDGKVAELRARLMNGETALSETWIYRWTA